MSVTWAIPFALGLVTGVVTFALAPRLLAKLKAPSPNTLAYDLVKWFASIVGGVVVASISATVINGGNPSSTPAPDSMEGRIIEGTQQVNAGVCRALPRLPVNTEEAATALGVDDDTAQLQRTPGGNGWYTLEPVLLTVCQDLCVDLGDETQLSAGKARVIDKEPTQGLRVRMLTAGKVWGRATIYWGGCKTFR